MNVIYKEIASLNRSMYLYYPPGANRTPFKRCSITILRDEDDEASVKRLLEEGLQELADREEIILSFPNPVDGRWNYDFAGKTDDVNAFIAFQDGMDRPDEKPIERLPNGVPTYESMISTWHPMNDTRYLIGMGTGADMACTLAACAPDNIAAVLSIGGRLCDAAIKNAVYAVMPISLVGSNQETSEYFVQANNAELTEQNEARTIYKNVANPLQCVVDERQNAPFSNELLHIVWDRMFSKTRRTNTGLHGDCEPRMNLNEVGFEIFIEDDRLDEAVKTPHTWFTHVPKSVRGDSSKKVPLMIFFHGGSDNPAEGADMSKFHELGEKEGFITVYPWGTNKAQWNMVMLESETQGMCNADDVGFTVALIRYMCENYPVDPQRVYLSGFSNGAAQAMVVALTHPDMIAAICPIDSNWPGNRVGPAEVNYDDIIPFRIAMELKQKYDYLMPIWYTYGSREPSYPVYKGSSQQHQYDFFKRYNHIEVVPTPEQNQPHPCGCGVPGEKYELLKPSFRHPHHEYDVHRFYTKDDAHLNLYNYVLMREKGHDIAEMDPVLGWNYVKQFRRLPDGSLRIVKED